MRIGGKSNREIAVSLGVSKNTVPNMLADSDILKEYRHPTLDARAPGAREHRLAVETLEESQYGSPRQGNLVAAGEHPSWGQEGNCRCEPRTRLPGRQEH